MKVNILEIEHQSKVNERDCYLLFDRNSKFLCRCKILFKEDGLLHITFSKNDKFTNYLSIAASFIINFLILLLYIKLACYYLSSMSFATFILTIALLPFIIVIVKSVYSSLRNTNDRLMIIEEYQINNEDEFQVINLLNRNEFLFQLKSKINKPKLSRIYNNSIFKFFWYLSERISNIEFFLVINVVLILYSSIISKLLKLDFPYYLGIGLMPLIVYMLSIPIRINNYLLYSLIKNKINTDNTTVT